VPQQNCPAGQSPWDAQKVALLILLPQKSLEPAGSSSLKQKQPGVHSPPIVQGFAQVPLLSPTLSAGQHMLLEQLPLQHCWAVCSVQGSPFGIHEGLQSPLTPSSPSAQRLKQLPQCLSFLLRFTHLPLQQVWFEAQRLEQLPQWRSFLLRFTHLSPQRVCPSEHRSAAHATPGTEPKALPTRRPPINLRALPRDREPLARALASSSKVRLVVCWLTCCPFSPKGGTLGD